MITSNSLLPKSSLNLVYLDHYPPFTVTEAYIFVTVPLRCLHDLCFDWLMSM